MEFTDQDITAVLHQIGVIPIGFATVQDLTSTGYVLSGVAHIVSEAMIFQDAMHGAWNALEDEINVLRSAQRRIEELETANKEI